ncbi:MAG: hypothetical protein K5892_03235 [Acholeplasmatales bacterium]|nr:hypothetical protein [Acholeplasmatales bacterium]
MNEVFAVIDTETTWSDQVMSIGIVISRFPDYKIIEKLYYVITPTYQSGGMYSFQLDNTRGIETKIVSRADALVDINNQFKKYDVKHIFAYNARFDYTHLPELSSYCWYDIMRIAAYKQYNDKLPDNIECCCTGRLKRNYGVENMYRYLTGIDYYEVHNAVCDAVDELEIMKRLDKELEVYMIGIIK